MSLSKLRIWLFYKEVGEKEDQDFRPKRTALVGNFTFPWYEATDMGSWVSPVDRKRPLSFVYYPKKPLSTVLFERFYKQHYTFVVLLLFSFSRKTNQVNAQFSCNDELTHFKVSALFLFCTCEHETLIFDGCLCQPRYKIYREIIQQ